MLPERRDQCDEPRYQLRGHEPKGGRAVRPRALEREHHAPVRLPLDPRTDQRRAQHVPRQPTEPRAVARGDDHASVEVVPVDHSTVGWELALRARWSRRPELPTRPRSHGVQILKGRRLEQRERGPVGGYDLVSFDLWVWDVEGLVIAAQQSTGLLSWSSVPAPCPRICGWMRLPSPWASAGWVGSGWRMGKCTSCGSTSTRQDPELQPLRRQKGDAFLWLWYGASPDCFLRNAGNISGHRHALIPVHKLRP